LGGGKQIRQKDRDEAKVSLKNRERVEVSLTVEARRQNLFNLNMAPVTLFLNRHNLANFHYFEKIFSETYSLKKKEYLCEKNK